MWSSSAVPRTQSESLFPFLTRPTRSPPASTHGVGTGRRRAGEHVRREKRPTKAPPPTTAVAARGALSGAEAEATGAETAHGAPEGVSAASESDTGAVEAVARRTATKAKATGGIATVTVIVIVTVTVIVIATGIGIAVAPVPAETTTSDRRAEKESGAVAAAGRGAAVVGRPLRGPASRPSLHGRAVLAKVVGAEKVERDRPAPSPGETGSRRGTEAGAPSSTRAKSPG